MRALASACALLLCFLLSPLPGLAQAAAVAGQTAALPAMLHIDILEGEGALNNIRQRDAREPIVQVTDENHKPVSGVAVLFLIHSGNNGATASFGGQSPSLSVTTGADGIAHAPNLKLGQTPGSFTIAVTATLGALVATAVIHQSAVVGLATSTTSTGAVAAHHTILGLSKVAAITIGSAAAAGLAVGLVEATKSSGTSVSLGSATVRQ